jgi:DNA-binding SARP family transcriptional activator
VPPPPLRLLQELIPMGGKDLTEEALTVVLWPDAEGDLAHRSFSTTLSRLRKLAGDEKAILLRDGMLTLSARHCWVDAWTFERLVDKAERVHKGKAGKERAEDSVRLLEKAVALYKGHFLADETRNPRVVSLRERLHGKFIRAVGAIGRHWENEPDLQKAVACYRKGLEVDNLVEEFYRSLMTCYRRMGNDAEVRATFMACRRVVSAASGVPPSPATEALYRSYLPVSRR